MTVAVLTKGKGLRDFVGFVEDLPDLINEAGYFTVVDTTRDALPLLRRTMESQIAFGSGYLNQDRLAVRKRPTRSSLESVISGRDRPTSLARFAKGATLQNSSRRPITVTVRTGKQTELKRAFLVKLRNGNIGLAIRLPDGQAPDNAYKPVQLTRKGGQAQNVWLLYGPSVDQVLGGIVPDVSPEIDRMLVQNFIRQLNRLSSRG